MQHKLKELRLEQKVSQERMAKLLGISRVSYNLKESGRYEFKQDEMFALAKFFNQRMDYIFLPRSHRNGDNDTKKEVD